MTNPRSTAQIAGHPIHPMLVNIPITCFIGTLLTDIAYWQTADTTWATFSAWLVTAGVVGGIAAAVAGLIDFIGSRRIREQPTAWLHLAGNALALVLSFFNVLVHTREAWLSVVPTGIILSALVVLILVFTGWLGGGLVFRHRVGVSDETS